MARESSPVDFSRVKSGFDDSKLELDIYRVLRPSRVRVRVYSVVNLRRIRYVIEDSGIDSVYLTAE